MKFKSLAVALGLSAVGIASSALADSQIPYGDRAGAALTLVGQSKWLWNSVTVSDDGRIFVGMPHWPGNESSPSVAELLPDGRLVPFPGGEFNQWQPGKPTGSAFVNINAVHTFDGKTLWVLDVGAPSLGKVVDADAAKVLQFDIKSGKLLRTIHPGAAALPEGANMNDLRMDQENLYITDSGLGGIIVINLKTGKALRRLSQETHTVANTRRIPVGEDGRLQRDGKGEPVQVHSDLIEISPDGKWLYEQTLTGPLWRVETRLLRDEKVSEDTLSKAVQFVYDTPPLVGTAMDNHGNLYMAEMDRPRITVLKPDGTLSVVAQDSRLWGPDALFITKQREIYVPIPQTSRQDFTQGPGAKSLVEMPYKLYKAKLPTGLGTQEPIPPVAR